MTIRTLAALALVAMLGIGVVAIKAHATSCATSCYGNTCYTNCY